VSSRKVGGISVHKSAAEGSCENLLFTAKGPIMSSRQPLSPELEAQAQGLLARLWPQAEEELRALARLLVSKKEHEIFGDTEFEARAIVHRIGATAYSAHLTEKKGGTEGCEDDGATHHQGGDSKRIFDVLRSHPLPHKKAVQEKRAEAVNYLSGNVHRMDYPRYLANGWMIGSGTVESACKTVVAQRLKQAGMR
jgi:hypothetical protein